MLSVTALPHLLLPSLPPPPLSYCLLSLLLTLLPSMSPWLVSSTLFTHTHSCILRCYVPHAHDFVVLYCTVCPLILFLANLTSSSCLRSALPPALSLDFYHGGIFFPLPCVSSGPPSVSNSPKIFLSNFSVSPHLDLDLSLHLLLLLY